MSRQPRKKASKTDQAAGRRTCLLVLGMHRSGTSALTRVLNLIGAALPHAVLGAGEGNEAGHWEPERLIAYHDMFLSEQGSNWRDWRPLDLTRMPLSRREQVKADIRDIIAAEYADAPLFVVKDPRICRFPGFFTEALEEAGIDVVPIFIFRNPLEVTASLQKRTVIWPETYTEADAALLWLSHVLEAEIGSRRRARAIVSYDALMKDWRDVVARICEQTGLDFPVAADDAAPLVTEFLSGDLRHHASKAGAVALDPVLRGWVSEAFEAMVKLAVKDGARQPQATLDRIHAEFVRSLPIIANLLTAATARNEAAASAAKEAQARVAATEARLGERDEEVRKFGEMLRDAEKGIASRAADIEHLRAQLATAQQERDAQEAELERRRGEIEHVRSLLGAETGDNRDLEQIIAAHAERDGERAGELEKLRAEAEKAATELEARSRRIESLEGSHNKFRRLIDERDEYAREREADFANRMADLERENDRIGREREEARTAAEDRSARLGELADEAAAMSAELAAAREELRSRERTMDASRSVIERLERDMLAREQELKEISEEIGRLHQSYQSSTSWRLTRPIRGVKRAVSGTATAVRLFPSALKFGGGVIPALRKGVRIAREEGAAGVGKRLELVDRLKQAHSSQPLPVQEKPLVSIIVPNYKHAEFLEQRLDSIYAQDYENFEVILLDDVSPDNSVEILSRYQTAHAANTRLVVNDINSGSGYRQWAKGLALARGELVWIAESDDWSDPSFLSRLVPLFADEAVSLAYANSSFMDADGAREVWTTDTYLRDLDDHLWTAQFTMTAHRLVALGWSVKNLVPNVSSAIFRHPGSDAALLHGEWSSMKICGDWLFYLNLIKGGRVAYLPDKLNFYRIHGGSTAKSTFSKDVYYREHEALARFVVSNFEVPLSFLDRQETNLKTHWAQNRETYSDAAFQRCYSGERVLASISERLPRVLMCGYAFAAGGGETFPIFLANMLRARGYPVTFLSFEQEPREPGVRRLLRRDIPVVCDFRNINRIVEDFGIDIIHSHHAWVDNTVLDLLAPDTRARTAISTHGMYEGLPDEHRERIVRRIADRSGGIVYTADKNLRPFIDYGLEDMPKLTRIPNALPDVKFDPIDRASIGVPLDAFVLCLVSRAIPDKGWEEAIRSVERARARSGQDIHLLLIGEGVECDRLKNANAHAFVHFLGFRQNLRDYYAASDAGFLPTRFSGESYPLTVIDCLATGTPVIATAVGEIPRMLDADGAVAGRLFELDEGAIPVDEVASHIAELAEDEKSYEEAKKRARVAYEKFNPDLMVERYEDVYRNIFEARLVG